MKKDYSQLAKNIVENVGGAENVKALTHCMTRLRFIVKDEAKVKMEKIKQLEGVVNVIISGGQHQVVIGTHVGDVYNAIIENTEIKSNKQKDEPENEASNKNRNVVAAFMEIISSLFLPVIKALTAVGILKGILIALTTLHWLSPESGTYTILYSAADAFFYFLPVILAYTAATKFGADKFLSVTIAGAMIYPTLISILNDGKALDFMGIPVKLISYTSSVIPIIVTVYVLSKLEKLLKKIIPNMVQGIFVPLLCLVIMVPSALIVIGPVTNEIGNGIAAGYTFIYNLSPAIAGGILATLWPIMIVFGVHWGLVPVVVNNLSKYGYDTLLPVTIATNFAMAGAVLGVFLKTKNPKLKQIAISSCISALIGGITEPAIYGVNMKYKKPFYIACVITGICGIITGISGAQWPGLMTVCALTLPTLALMKGGIGVLISAVIGFFGTAICTYLFGFNDSMIEKSDLE
jgi:Phosphotransferase system IIC components, glucose/maltose/N-acetylglucosamine-specific